VLRASQERQRETASRRQIIERFATPARLRERGLHVTDPWIEVDLAIRVGAVRAGDSYRAADHAKTIAKQPGVSVVLIAPEAGRAARERFDHIYRLDQLQVSSSRTWRSLRANASGWPGYPISPPMKPR
jgi:hypothetical protein